MKQSIHFFTIRNADTKASIVERFQWTLKARIWRCFTKHRTMCYVDILPDVVHGYNHTYHCSIRKAPAKVNAQNVLKVWKTLYSKPGKPETPSALKVGNRVWIRKAKRTFEKGYLPNLTTELVTISRKVPGRNAYRIEDHHGEELEQVVKTDDVYEVEEVLVYKKRRMGKTIFPEVKVRWKGYTPSFDSFIPQADLIPPTASNSRNSLQLFLCLTLIITSVVMLALKDLIANSGWSLCVPWWGRQCLVLRWGK
jgi:hypothetical protein